MNPKAGECCLCFGPRAGRTEEGRSGEPTMPASLIGQSFSFKDPRDLNGDLKRKKRSMDVSWLRFALRVWTGF